MSKQTCYWCGKQFDSTNAFRGGVNRYNTYCSVRCEKAGENARQKENQRQREQTEKFLRQIGGGNSTIGGLIVAAVVLVFVLIYRSSNRSGEEKTKEIQEIVSAQQKTEEVETQTQQTNTVSLLDESIVVSAEPENIIMPEPLDIPERQIEVFEVEEIIEPEELDLEEEVRPDFSKQRIYQSVEVDEEPQFPNGEHGLLEYIAENINYPQAAMDEGIAGRVFVSFIVEPDGSISNAKVVRGIGYGCDEEAIRIIESLPTLEPGRRRNKEVRVAMTVPVNFKLQ